MERMPKKDPPLGGPSARLAIGVEVVPLLHLIGLTIVVIGLALVKVGLLVLGGGLDEFIVQKDGLLGLGVPEDGLPLATADEEGAVEEAALSEGGLFILVAEEEVGGEGEGVVDIAHCIYHHTPRRPSVKPISKIKNLFLAMPTAACLCLRAGRFVAQKSLEKKLKLC